MRATPRVAKPARTVQEMIIALHGDLATAEMLKRDVGDLSDSIDLFFDAGGWRKFGQQVDRLLRLITEPPTLIGYSRGGSVIALLSTRIEIRAAVLYESPVIDSEGVGGHFPVLQIWNDRGCKFGRRREQALRAEQLWSGHKVTPLVGRGRHMRLRPLGHAWDCSLNSQIRKWHEDLQTPRLS